MFDFDFEGSLPWIFTGAAGLLGRLMFHAKEVQMLRRKPISWVLLWDLPIALGMGWIALGIGKWIEAPGEVVISIALAISYLGPHGIDIAFAKWSEKSNEEKKDG
jgi:LydA holin phage, holin superfamily III